MRRRTLLSASAGAGGIAALGALSACGKSEEAAPNDGMESVADVSQPLPPPPVRTNPRRSGPP